MKINLMGTMLMSLLCFSCVNSFSEKDEQINVESDNIPITFSSRILQSYSNKTRMYDNAFEEDDKIGVFVLKQFETLGQNRCVDNALYTLNGTDFVSNEQHYYPDSKLATRFISYYPYNQSGVAVNTETISIQTMSDQSTNSNYGLSDFLSAKTENVIPSNNPVLLEFMHQLCKVNFVVQSIYEEDLDDIKENCNILVNGMNSMADFNLETFEITNRSSVTQTTPNGDWSVAANNKVTGKKMIVIPQNLSSATILLQINDRLFTCSFPDLTMEAGTSYTITIKYDSKVGINGISHQINDWVEDDTDYEVELEEEFNNKLVSINLLDFNLSSIYEVREKNGDRMGVVCKEYLSNDQIDDVAIVYYADKNPLHGTILKVIDVDGDIHGGTVTWNETENTFNYNVGNKAVISLLSINQNGELVDAPSENSPYIVAQPNMLVDIRGGESISYPTVKIGKQIWLRNNLKATRYIGGTLIDNNTERLDVITAGYYVNNNNVFYNTASIIEGGLNPDGWDIPTVDQWQTLIDYVGNVSAKLKAGNDWVVVDGITPSSNLSGFNGLCVGGFYTKDLPFAYFDKNTFTFYWRMENDRTSYTPNIVALSANDNNMKYINVYNSCAFAIRLIKN